MAAKTEEQDGEETGCCPKSRVKVNKTGVATQISVDDLLAKAAGGKLRWRLIDGFHNSFCLFAVCAFQWWPRVDFHELHLRGKFWILKFIIWRFSSGISTQRFLALLQWNGRFPQSGILPHEVY